MEASALKVLLAKIKAATRLEKDALAARVAERTRELEQELAERKRAEEELRTLLLSAQREATALSALVGSMTDEVWFADVQGRFTLANPAARKEFDIAHGDAVGVEDLARGLEVFRPDGSARPGEEAPPLRALAGEVVLHQEEIVRTPATGQLRHRQVSAAPVRDPTGSIIGSVSVVRDITECRRTEDAFRQLSGRHEAILQEIPDIVVEVDANKAYTWANPVALEFFGDDVIGRQAADYFVGEQETYQNVQPLFEGDEGTFYVESWQRRKDGQRRLLAWWCRALKDADGRVTGALSTARDITERRQAEDALSASEARYRRLFEAAKDGILILDAETGFVRDVNPFLVELLGYSREQFLAKTIWDQGFLRDVIPNCDKLLELQRQAYVRHEHLSLVSADGRRIDVELVSNAYLVDHTKVIQCNIRDISARTRADRALRESETRFDQLAAQSGTVVWEVDAHGLYTYLSHVSEAIWGYRPEEIVGRLHFYDLHPESGREELKEAAFAVFERKASFENLVNAVQAKDGRLVWVSTNGIPIVDADGTLRGYRGGDTDITGRKQAEDALRASEAKYRVLVENQTDLVVKVDNAGRFLFVSPSYCEVFGKREDELLGQAFMPLVHPGDQASTVDAMRALDVPPHRAYVEQRAMTRAGWRWLAWQDTAVVDEHGQVIEIVGVGRDITERKRAEDALRRSEEQLRLALDAASAVAWVDDFAGGTLTEIGPVERIFGKPAGFRHVDSASFLQDIHPDDRARLIAALRAPARAYSVEFRVPFADGGVRWLQAVGRFERDSEGRPVRLLGIARDITEHKQAGEEISRQNATTDAINRVLRKTLLCETAEEVARHGLAVAEELTGSQFGWIGEVNAAGRLDTIALSDPGYERCKIPGSQTSAMLQDMEIHGILGRVLPGGTPLIVNDPAAHPDWVGLPDGHPPVTAFLGVPLESGGKILGMIALANNPLGYGPHDRKAVERLSVALVEALKLKRAEKEREKLDAQLTQAQKMESVGRLAGGVAHDFNNALSVIVATAERAMGRTPPGDRLARDLQTISDAALRSANLTRQLLAFARKQTIEPKVLDVNDAVTSMLRMLRRLIGEDIDLVFVPGAGLWHVKMDPAQIDQILANLLVNARDAIGGVGKVTIATHNLTIDQASSADHADCVAGEYVLLTVSDDGCGMAKDVLDQVFEPFFTTKPVGQGTGLGLATVFGIVHQNAGAVSVDSAPGKGATFRIYLPRVAGAVPCTRAAGAAAEPHGHGETILLVEDEPDMLAVVADTLAGLGYLVLTAGKAGGAMEVAREHPGEIHLLVTDVVMPEMNGKDLAARLTASRPGLRCLFVSGYTADVIAQRGVLDEGVHFLQKPFSRSSLAVKIRQVLDEVTRASGVSP